MQKLVWQNANGVELDLTSGNYGITEWEGFSNASLNIQSQQVPFQDGGVFLDALIEQRELSVTLAMQDNNNLELRYQQRRELISALNPKLGEGYLIYTNDYTSKRIKCVAQIPLFETHNSDTVGTPKASLSWTACEPYWEDLEDTEIDFVQAGKVIEVENKGDVHAQIKAEILCGGEITGATIRNQTTGKYIEIDDTVNNDVLINTNIGQKSIQEEKMSLKYSFGRTYAKTSQNKDLLLIETQDGNYNVSRFMSFDKNDNFDTINLIGKNMGYWGKYFFVLDENNVLYKSEDGKKWSVAYTSEYDITVCCYVEGNYYIYLHKVVYESETIIINKVAITSNFEQFQLQDTTGFNTLYGIGQIEYFDEMFFSIAVGEYLYRSSDGISWASYTLYGEYKTMFMMNNKLFISSRTSSAPYSINLTVFESNSSSRVVFEKQSSHIIRNGCYANGVYLICGDAGLCYRSEDLSQWEQIDTGTENYFRACCYFDNLFLLFGSGGCVLFSYNAQTWKKKTIFLESTTATLTGMTYTGEKYIITSGYELTPFIIESVTGENWIQRTIPYSYRIMNVCNLNENEYLVSVELGNATYDIYKTDKEYVSWEKLNTTSYFIKKVVHFNNSYFCVTNAGVFKTVDFDTFEGVGGKNSVFVKDDVLYMSDDNVAYKSTDGESFTQIFEYETENTQNCFMNYGNGVFVIVGNEFVATSEDGEDWTVLSAIVEAGSVVDCIFCKNQFYVLMSNNILYASPLGKNWGEKVQGTFGSSIASNDKNILIRGQIMVDIADYEETDNIISKLSYGSDMSLNLKEGLNQLKLNYNDGSAIAKLVFRQKYLGV